MKGPANSKTRMLEKYAKQSHVYASSKVEGNQILAQNQIFIRKQATNGATTIVWSIFNLEENFTKPNEDDAMTRYIRSGVVHTQDGSSWVLELRPKSHTFF